MDNTHFSIACQAAELRGLHATRYKVNGEQRIMLTYGGSKLSKHFIDDVVAAIWSAYFYPRATVITNDGSRFVISIPTE